MLDKTDYANLLAIVARGTYNGIQEAAAAVALYSKLQQLVTPPEAAGSTVDGNDSKGGT